jgi:alkanesulfonate monooxygenase SsuD/methylene tetrahydromethanopterin reductase-like flavin-dependent oxidoreductase (luciferase family)
MADLGSLDIGLSCRAVAQAPSPAARTLGGRIALTTGGMPVDAVVAAARQAEQLGYEAVLVGEAGMEADAFVTAAAVLRATRRIRCGPGIANAYDRHPTVLARGAATLDRLAPGRALLGIGRSEPDYIAGALDLPWRPTPLPDAVRIARTLLAGSAVDHTGRRWSAHRPAPPTRAAAQHRVPVLLAAVGRQALQLAGAEADGVILNYGASVDYVRWAVDQVAEGARRAGRDPADVDVYGLLLTACSDDPDPAGRLERLERTRHTVSEVHALPDQGSWLAMPSGEPPARWDDATLARFALVGTRRECLARIDAYRAVGLRCPVLMPSGMRSLHA